MGGGNRARIDDVAEETPLLSATCPTSKFSTKLGPLGELIAPLLMMFPERSRRSPWRQVDGYGGVVRGREGPAVADVAGKQRGVDFLNVNAIAAAGKNRARIDDAAVECAAAVERAAGGHDRDFEAEAPRSVPVLTMLPVKVPPLAVTFVAILMAEKCAVMAPVLVTPPEKFITSFRTIPCVPDSVPALVMPPAKVAVFCTTMAVAPPARI